MSEIINPQAGDPVSMDRWIKMLPAVEGCIMKMDELYQMFGPEVFHVCCTILMEGMDAHYFYQTERFRYFNSKLAGGESKVGKLFIPPKDPRNG